MDVVGARHAPPLRRGSAADRATAMAVAKGLAFWHSMLPRVKPPCSFGCGCSSGVEHNLAKVGVEGSHPFARSKKTLTKSAHLADFRACVVASLCLNKPRTVPTSVIDLGNRWAKCSRNVPRAVDRGHWPIDPLRRSGALRRLDPQAERRAVARSRNAAGGHCRSMLIGFVETRGRVQRRSVSVHCSGEPCENRAWSRLDGFLTLIQLLQ